MNWRRWTCERGVTLLGALRLVMNVLLLHIVIHHSNLIRRHLHLVQLPMRLIHPLIWHRVVIYPLKILILQRYKLILIDQLNLLLLLVCPAHGSYLQGIDRILLSHCRRLLLALLARILLLHRSSHLETTDHHSLVTLTRRMRLALTSMHQGSLRSKTSFQSRTRCATMV